MKDKIIMTQNLVKGAELVEKLKNRTKRSDCLGLIFGRWGFGKSTFIEWIYTNIECFYARALEAWGRSVNMMVESLLAAYRVEPMGMLKADLPELSRTIKKHGHPLFIDEADRLARKTSLIETVRDLHDMCRVPIILVGSENIISLLQRRDLGPVFSRISAICQFQELTSKDIEHIALELCELRCDTKVAAYIRTVTLGDFRLVNALLVRAEVLCGLNDSTDISMSIAKEASTAMPHPDDLRRVIESKKVVNHREARAAGAG
jgi:hypothetical protein